MLSLSTRPFPAFAQCFVILMSVDAQPNDGLNTLYDASLVFIVIDSLLLVARGVVSGGGGDGLKPIKLVQGIVSDLPFFIMTACESTRDPGKGMTSVSPGPRREKDADLRRRHSRRSSQRAWCPPASPTHAPVPFNLSNPIFQLAPFAPHNPGPRSHTPHPTHHSHSCNPVTCILTTPSPPARARW